MILVEKRLIKKPASLVGSKSAAAIELTKAKAHYNQKNQVHRLILLQCTKHQMLLKR